jgi:hypothetical protein
MLYDLSDGPPPPGSLLESVFLLIAKRRQEAQFFATKILMEAAIIPHVKDQGDVLAKTYEAYRDAMFPFLAGETKRAAKSTKKQLEQWTKTGPLRVRPLWRPQDSSGLISRLKRGAAKVEQQEAERRKVPHKRI